MAIALCPQGHMLTDGDLACPTCGAPRESSGVEPASVTRPANGSPARPISEILDLTQLPSTNGSANISSWEANATYPTTVDDDVEQWDDEQQSWDEPAAVEPPWNGRAATAPSDSWTPPAAASPPAPSWTPPAVDAVRPLPLQADPPRFAPAPAATRPPAPAATRTTKIEQVEETERFALLGGLDPRRLSGVSRRTWLILAAVGVAILVTIAVVFALEQWQRALNAEHELDATRNRVSTQSQTIEGLSGRVLSLNSEIDKTSDLLTRAQDKAAVSGKDLEALSTAIGELATARELMRAAVVNITKMTEALELKEFKKAGEFAAAASSQLEQAFVHEQRASQSLN